MRRLLTLLSLVAGGSALSAATGTGVATAACNGAKAEYAKVQLWADANCGGGSRSVGRSGEDDRPDFNAFRGVDGQLHDISNTRSSVGIAANWCVRFFDFKSYGGTESPLYCAGGPGPSYHDLRAFDDRATAMRTCPNQQRSLCAKVPTETTPTGTPEPEPEPPIFEDPLNEEPLPPEPTPEPDPVFDEPFFEPGPGGAGLGPLGPNDGLRFDRATKRCSRGSLRGARAFRVWLDESGIAQRTAATIYRCAKRRSRRDLHANGRAIDVHPVTQEAGRELVAMLLADDYALIRRMGIQEIIFDRQVWSSSRPTRLMRRYRGPSPHRKTVHIGLNRQGAAMRTSFWQGR